MSREPTCGRRVQRRRERVGTAADRGENVLMALMSLISGVGAQNEAGRLQHTNMWRPAGGTGLRAALNRRNRCVLPKRGERCTFAVGAHRVCRKCASHLFGERIGANTCPVLLRDTEISNECLMMSGYEATSRSNEHINEHFLNLTDFCFFIVPTDTENQEIFANFIFIIF